MRETDSLAVCLRTIGNFARTLRLQNYINVNWKRETREGHAVNERKELLNILREMWQTPDSSLHRIYSSWEELENHIELTTDATIKRERSVVHPCPNCGEKQVITRIPNDIFPYQTCLSCRQPYHINRDLTIRRISEEEKENLPAPWVQIIEDIHKKKMAVTFKLE